MAQLDLHSASAAKRLAAKLVDGIPPALLTGIAALIAMPLIGYEQVSASSAVVDLSMFLIVTGAGSLLALVYWILLWGWEAKTGKTTGNLIFGIRTTNEEGLAPGWLAVFLRNLIIGLSGIVPVLGFVLVMISNLFDPSGKRQGWYDKAARTFVFDVRHGRDPLTTGGVGGPASFAPQVPAPALQPIASPVVAPAGATNSSGHVTMRPGTAPSAQEAGPSGEENAERGPAPSRFQPTDFAPEPAVSLPEKVPTGRTAPLPDLAPTHPDDDAGETVVSRRSPAVPVSKGIRIRLDDGRNLLLQSVALIGRNPAAGHTETAQLIPVEDEGRSVSKTHLHLRVEDGRLWVTDRYSTNGSAVTGVDGNRTALPGGQAYWVDAGSTVHFGDRSFRVERA